MERIHTTTSTYTPNPKTLPPKTNLSDQRYPTIQVIIPPQLAYQHHQPKPFDAFPQSLYDNDTGSDSDETDNDDSKTQKPATYGTYNPTSIRPTVNPLRQTNQHNQLQTNPTESTQTSSIIPVTQPLQPITNTINSTTPTISPTHNTNTPTINPTIQTTTTQTTTTTTSSSTSTTSNMFNPIAPPY